MVETFEEAPTESVRMALRVTSWLLVLKPRGRIVSTYVIVLWAERAILGFAVDTLHTIA
jgi:hypothetical protein